VGDVTSGGVFKYLADFIWPWAPTRLFWLIFLETRRKSTSSEPLIGFSAYLKPKLWLKNPIFNKNKKLRKRHDLPSRGKLWPAITPQQIELESCSVQTL